MGSTAVFAADAQLCAAPAVPACVIRSPDALQEESEGVPQRELTHTGLDNHKTLAAGESANLFTIRIRVWTIGVIENE